MTDAHIDFRADLPCRNKSRLVKRRLDCMSFSPTLTSMFQSTFSDIISYLPSMGRASRHSQRPVIKNGDKAGKVEESWGSRPSNKDQEGLVWLQRQRWTLLLRLGLRHLAILNGKRCTWCWVVSREERHHVGLFGLFPAKVVSAADIGIVQMVMYRALIGSDMLQEHIQGVKDG